MSPSDSEGERCSEREKRNIEQKKVSEDEVKSFILFRFQYNAMSIL